MKKPFLIILDGPIGSGKTTVSELLHKRLKKTALISLDKVKRLVSDYKPGHKYHNLASQVGKVMAKEYLKNGWNVIVEKAFTREKFIQEYLNFKKNKNIKVFVYQMTIPFNVAIKRVRQREKLRDKISKLSTRRIERNYNHYDLYSYKKAKTFDSVKLKPQKIVKEILKDLK